MSSDNRCACGIHGSSSRIDNKSWVIREWTPDKARKTAFNRWTMDVDCFPSPQKGDELRTQLHTSASEVPFSYADPITSGQDSMPP